jgi:hypothetical protein
VHDADIVERRAAASHGQHARDRRGKLDRDKVAVGKFGSALDDELALAGADLDFDRRAAAEHRRRIDREDVAVRSE